MLPCERPRPWKIAILLEINEFPFRLCCPAGGLDLGKSLFFGNKRISFLTMLPCGRPRPWEIVNSTVFGQFWDCHRSAKEKLRGVKGKLRDASKRFYWFGKYSQMLVYAPRIELCRWSNTSKVSVNICNNNHTYLCRCRICYIYCHW